MENIIKGMKFQTEQFEDALFWRSKDEGFIPTLHHKKWWDEGECEIGAFTLKFNGELYEFHIEESEGEIDYGGGDCSDTLPTRYVTIYRVNNGRYILLYEEEDFPGIDGCDSLFHVHLSYLLEAWDGLLTREANRRRRPLLR